MLRTPRAAILISCILLFLALNTADAIKLPKINLGNKTLEKVLTGAGIVLLVKQFGGALNDFINTLLLQRGAAIQDATKVVPIMTFGQGSEAGACQVSGPPEQVRQVKLVLAVAATFDKGRRFNVQALVPSSSLNPIELKRVPKVGISAIIDYRL